ncbi:ABC transporter substrate-binding protein [Cohnella lubricantis]|uniref:Extracellular solute-binding protein n=1 Tax=Cohnella lubricantis TaxID=2163172 RepID=A0A841TC49_9BACL|nr:extracellular solute-binding protein [Cohnella lubricantis]MBB6678874.1 extracellular solute-binding protein [Cohnella lubricantis]MBP2120200.1 multiple sugar transport system substrate-binding protein [Cohnella lubricantis]
MIKAYKYGWIILILIAVLAGCVQGEQNTAEAEKIKVMYVGKQSFYEQYGFAYMSQYPDAGIEVAVYPMIDNAGGNEREQLEAFIEDQQPDVLLLNLNQYEELAAQGGLVSLSSYIQQDKYDIESIYPPLIKQLKEAGNGELYGLSPTFANAALFYNEDLFNEYGVEMPRDLMTWDEVLALADRFAADAGHSGDRICGLSSDLFDSIASLLSVVGSSQNLSAVTPDAARVTIDSDSWRKVFQSVVPALEKGTISLVSEEDLRNEDNDPFLAGRCAMSLNYKFKANQIMQSQSNLPHWGIVTAPIDANDRSNGAFITQNRIFAINANSQHPDAAWQLLKYLSSEEYARSRSQISDQELLARIPSNVDDPLIAPFYSFKTAHAVKDPMGPPEFQSELSSIITFEVNEVLSGNKTLDDALVAIQNQAQGALK